MAIGDHVLYNGRRYLLIGIDPMSVTDRRAQLDDLETGERVRALLDEVQDLPASEPDFERGLGKNS
jgi:hypothetical protein